MDDVIPGPLQHLRALPRGPIPLVDLSTMVAQLGLSELRAIAREYEISTTGISKQQLAEAITGALQQPEAVRKVAATLEKPQRQLLATIVLAGGSVTDEDLRGLYERFSFGQPEKLQDILAVLQNKALLFRTSLNRFPQQRLALSGSFLDTGWHVPSEVRAVLRVSVPVTHFNVQEEADRAITIQHVEPYSLLAKLLLVARALHGYPFEQDRDARLPAQPSSHASALARLPGAAREDRAIIPPPADFPPASLIETLQAAVPHSPAFLRYAFHLLRLADILHRDDTGSPYLRLLPNAARLLIGPGYREVARDLFELWLTQPGYDELFELQEEGLRLQCYSTPLNHPVLRSGELEMENAEARQAIVALVAQAPLNQWISFPAFARFIYRLNPLFLQKRQRLFPSPHWWIEQEEGRPLQPMQVQDWMRAEGHYLARMIRGPLHWWGITNLAVSKEGRLLAFCLTPMAGLLLNGLEPDELDDMHDYQDTLPLLEVEETGGLLLASSPGAWPMIELIEDFAEAAGVRRGRLHYRLTPKALAGALGRGLHPALLLQQLRVIAENLQDKGSLAQVLAQIERWAASYGRVRIYTGASMLEVADPSVMRELALTTSVEQYIVQPISPTLTILKKQGVERVTEELKRRGQIPLLHEEVYYHGTE